MQESSRFPKLALFAVLALLFAVAFHLVVYIHFQKFRTRISDVQQPDEAGNIWGDFEASPEERNTFRNLILRLSNNGSSHLSFAVHINADFIGAVEVSPQSSRKFDLHLIQNLNWKKHNRLKVKGEPGRAWQLDRAEISNYYGSSKGAIDFIVLNRESAYEAPKYIWSAVIFLFASLVGWLLVFRGRSGFISRLHLIILSVVITLLFCALVLPLLTKYRVVFSFHTFLILLAISYFPLLPLLLTSATRQGPQISDRRLFWASLGVIAIFVFYLSAMLQSLEIYGDYSAFLRLTDKNVRRNPFLRQQKELREKLVTYESGYDGMFMYFITFDPFAIRYSGNEKEYGKFIDFPPYRFGRIGYPLLTKAFSFNKPELYPKVMVFLIVFSHLFGALFLVKILLHCRLNPLWSLLYLSVPAFCVSLENALPESIACAFLLAGAYFYLRNRITATSIMLAASILVRETGAIFLIALIFIEAFRRHRKQTLLLLAGLAPYILWKTYLGFKFVSDYGMRSFTGGGDVFTFPFGGLIQLWSSLQQKTFRGDPLGAIFFSLLITGIFVVACILLRRQRDPFMITLFCYSLIGVCLNYRKVWLFVPNAERATYEVFIFLILTFISIRNYLNTRQTIAFLALFVLIFVYDLFFLSVVSSFRNGFSLIYG